MLACAALIGLSGSVALAKVLPPPSVIAPPDGTETSLTPVLEWRPVPRAVGYRLVVALDAKALPTAPTDKDCRGRCVINAKVGAKATRYPVPPDFLRAGTQYHWTVHALHSERGAWSTPTSFRARGPSIASPSPATPTPTVSQTTTASSTPTVSATSSPTPSASPSATITATPIADATLLCRPCPNRGRFVVEWGDKRIKSHGYSMGQTAILMACAAVFIGLLAWALAHLRSVYKEKKDFDWWVTLVAVAVALVSLLVAALVLWKGARVSQINVSPGPVVVVSCAPAPSPTATQTSVPTATRLSPHQGSAPLVVNPSPTSTPDPDGGRAWPQLFLPWIGVGLVWAGWWRIRGQIRRSKRGREFAGAIANLRRRFDTFEPESMHADETVALDDEEQVRLREVISACERDARSGMLAAWDEVEKQTAPFREESDTAGDSRRRELAVWPSWVDRLIAPREDEAPLLALLEDLRVARNRLVLAPSLQPSDEDACLFVVLAFRAIRWLKRHRPIYT